MIFAEKLAYRSLEGKPSVSAAGTDPDEGNDHVRTARQSADPAGHVVAQQLFSEPVPRCTS
jgi:hypothetical protein